jgi:nitroreductase
LILRENIMAGIVFLKTNNLDVMKEFYIGRAGMRLWLEQEDCAIFQHGNLLLGFCQRDEIDSCGIVTVFYEQKAAVDAAYRELSDCAEDKPKMNEKYQIYHFFARDPEQRLVEFQSFLHPVDPHLSAEEALLTRRSIRRFLDIQVPDDLLERILEICRFVPTSRNAPSYYFIAVQSKREQEFFASLRGESSAPIARAPLAVAVCSDPAESKRHVQDGCIAAYHLLLAAWSFGLGTCWIGGMDRDDVKDTLQIPREHHVATITPLGYPAETPRPPARRAAEELLRFR